MTVGWSPFCFASRKVTSTISVQRLAILTEAIHSFPQPLLVSSLIPPENRLRPRFPYHRHVHRCIIYIYIYIYIAEYELTPWIRVLLEKLIVAYLVKNSSPFMEPESYLLWSQKPSLISVLSRWIQPTPLHPVSPRSIIILSLYEVDKR
jgi:hypothetical protein